MSEQAVISDQLEDSHSPHGQVTLPCGLLRNGELHTTAMIREISGHEEDMLGSEKIKPLEKITRLLAACVRSIGPVSGKDVAQAVRELTFGDRLWLVLQIRRLTLGDVFPYTAQCPNANCRKKEMYRVHLGDLVPVKMGDPARRVYEVELPVAKQTARFHVLTGVDEEEIAKHADNSVSRALQIRLELIGERRPTLEEVRDLSMRDRDAIRGRIDEVEGGVDTSVEMTCPHCAQEHELDLDISQQGFFFPSRVQKALKKKSSS